MPAYLYAQGHSGKYHEAEWTEKVRPYVWRVRTRCGQQLDETHRSYTGYVHIDERCRHCFPPVKSSWETW